MISYSLKCKNDHSFDSWFGSSEDFARLKAAGHVTCAICGSSEVEKSVMAPRLVKSKEAGPLSQPASAAEQALRAMREKIEASAEDVGQNFAAEARKIHDGDAPERSIYGQAKPEEARALAEDGIPVAPLPWGNRKAN